MPIKSPIQRYSVETDAVQMGLWLAVEYLIVIRGATVYATDICRDGGITPKIARNLSKETGFHRADMLRFIREELREGGK